MNEAKRQVAGMVRIDGPAGPSEILMLVDEVADLVDFHGKYFKATGAHVGVSGAFDADVEGDLSRLVAPLAGEPAEVAAITPPEPPQHRVVVLVDKPGRTQAQVQITQLGLDHRAPSFPAFQLTNDAFGIGFSGRLMKEVRVARGWSYYAYSYPMLRERGVFEAERNAVMAAWYWRLLYRHIPSEIWALSLLFRPPFRSPVRTASMHSSYLARFR